MGMPTAKKPRVSASDTRVSTVVANDLYKRVKIAAITNDISIQEAISHALEEWVKKHGM